MNSKKAAAALHHRLQPGELPAPSGLAKGSQGLVIAQPSSEANQDGGPDCAPRSADYLPAS